MTEDLKFDEWFYGDYGKFSTRAEAFYTDCEIENVEDRKSILKSWIYAAYEMGQSL